MDDSSIKAHCFCLVNALYGTTCALCVSKVTRIEEAAGVLGLLMTLDFGSFKDCLDILILFIIFESHTWGVLVGSS